MSSNFDGIVERCFAQGKPRGLIMTGRTNSIAFSDRVWRWVPASRQAPIESALSSMARQHGGAGQIMTTIAYDASRQGSGLTGDSGGVELPVAADGVEEGQYVADHGAVDYRFAPAAVSWA